MSKRVPGGRAVDGVLVLDKPTGITSSAAVQKVKRLFNARKVGHTGSLDPLATGILPLCFGQATKFSQFLLTADKRYMVHSILGIATDSGDSEGAVIAQRAADHVNSEALLKVMENFRGEIQQIPSMFSAIKSNGQPLYKLARQGLEVPRDPRTVTLFRNDLVCMESPRFTLDIHCSKGTYVRTVVADIGEELGCGAHVTSLRRVAVGPFREQHAVSFAQLEKAKENNQLDELLLPISSTVNAWPSVLLTNASAYLVQHGQAVTVPGSPTEGWVQLRQTQGEGTSRFLGVGEILNDGRVAPRRIVATSN